MFGLMSPSPSDVSEPVVMDGMDGTGDLDAWRAEYEEAGDE